MRVTNVQASAILECNEHGVCPLQCKNRTGLHCTIPEIDILDVCSDLLEARQQRDELLEALKEAHSYMVDGQSSFKWMEVFGILDKAIKEATK